MTVRTSGLLEADHLPLPFFWSKMNLKNPRRTLPGNNGPVSEGSLSPSATSATGFTLIASRCSLTLSSQFLWISAMYRSYSHRVSRKVPGLIVENDYWNDLKADKIQQPIDLSENREVNSSPDGGNYLKVVCISDTHNRLNESHEIPDGDVLIVAGDITNRGDEEEIERFNHQMSLRPHKHKLVIAGNYEFGWDKRENLNTRRPRYAEIKGIPDGGRLLKGVRYLEDEEITIDGVKFYGSPWHPNPGYPFYADRNGGLAKKWERVPNDTDVLITHTPPLGYLDLYANEEHWGCRDLLEKVEEIAPKFHVFGHVHYCNGAVSNGRTIFINAAQLRKGKIYENSPIVFYIEKKKEDLS